MKHIQKILILMSLPVMLYASQSPAQVMPASTISPDTIQNNDIPADIVQIKKGNFLLPTSQQPSSLFSLGQNIVDKGDKLALLGTFGLFGPNKYAIGMVPAFLYGITNKCSILLAVPFSFQKEDIHKSAGLADLNAQIEYAYYEYARPTYIYQATCLARVSAPTGSTTKTPVLGAGGPSILFGGTVSYYSIDWFWFVSAGGTLATKGRRMKEGSNFLYEGGFGKNIGTRPGWIFAWMIEFNGRYQTRNYLCSVIEHNSGFNVLFLTPSLWVSSERLIFQAGITLLPVQHLFGCQTRNEIGGLIVLGWKFNT